MIVDSKRIVPDQASTDNDHLVSSNIVDLGVCTSLPLETQYDGTSEHGISVQTRVEEENRITIIAPSNQPTKCCKCSKGRWRCFIVWFSIACVLVATAIVVVMVTNREGDQDQNQNQNQNQDQDQEIAIRDFLEWPTTGHGGLTLTVLNALDDKWISIFDNSIHDWDNGNPDSLTLEIVKIPHEVDCRPAISRVKVCNGDYGKTDWIGIITIRLRNDHVVDASIRLNDYHLDKREESWRILAMCHELGHAWGLPHSDEEYNNPNLGNCLDYTLHPEGNLYPGQYNFDLLAEHYGTVATAISRAYNGLRGDGVTDRIEAIPEDIQNVYESTISALDMMSCTELANEIPEYDVKVSYGNSEHLKGGTRSERCSVDLGEGHVMEASKLIF
mmetsp:Transcript_24419/g.44169  ORF Transcript_24419/g.44169 Transcript_24419/m.44169 type:complete len:387 (-) Transcript_24419:39-1199(-)